MKQKVWVLMRQRRDTDYTGVMGVYATREALLERVEKVRAANKQYPMRKINENAWTVGPEEDEGFFGNAPVDLFAQEADFIPS